MNALRILLLISTTFLPNRGMCGITDLMTPLDLLKQCQLVAKAVIDPLDPEVYLAISDSIAGNGPFEIFPKWQSEWPATTIAWATVPRQDPSNHRGKGSMTFEKGVSLLDVIRGLAREREEHVVEREWGVILVPRQGAVEISPEAWIKPIPGPSADRIRDFLDLAILGNIRLVEVDPKSEEFIEFLNIKLADSAKVYHKGGPAPFVRTDRRGVMESRPAIKVSFVGVWTYKNLLNTAAILCGMECVIDDDGVVLRVRAGLP